MKRLAVAATALVVAGCGDSTDPKQKLAQCAESWNATSDDKRYLAESHTTVKVRVSRFVGGECAVIMNRDGVVGGFAVHDGRWGTYVKKDDGLIGGNMDDFARLAGPVFEEGYKEPNVTVDSAGNVRPIAGAQIGVLPVDL